MHVSISGTQRGIEYVKKGEKYNIKECTVHYFYKVLKHTYYMQYLSLFMAYCSAYFLTPFYPFYLWPEDTRCTYH